MLAVVEQTRKRLSRDTAAKKKSRLGQFLTPEPTARFMASLFPRAEVSECRLLDPGAGIGSLSAAFLHRWRGGSLGFDSVDVTACEIDETIHNDLSLTFSSFGDIASLNTHIFNEDFVERAVNWIQFRNYVAFTHAILNPPYGKIKSNSRHRILLRQVGIETVNLYSAFVALALDLLAPGGQLVAIIPRSFCNGPYYKPFREFILGRSALRHIHLFESRNKAFKDDGVLQENVIVSLERGGDPGDITITTSTDDTFDDLDTHVHAFNRIVHPDDVEHFIHVPTASGEDVIERSPAIHYSLADIGVHVSTGPVVDFRLKEHLRPMPVAATVPLLYPCHLVEYGVAWPKEGAKKPNAICRNAHTEKWLYPVGFYCVVRRFSSKEEPRRIVASVVDPGTFSAAAVLGFENHLNVFHEHKAGLPEALAWGLCVFLNTTAVDEHFRRFNGHTQVNAMDLKTMKYPSRAALITFGEWARSRQDLTQAMIDARLETLAT